MDATHRIVCKEDLFNPVSTMSVQVSAILVISHFFHLVLKAIGQSGPIAQILAGLVLGPSGLSNIEKVRVIFFQSTSADYYEIFEFFCRIFFVFLIGLETDIPYILRNLRVASSLAYGGVVAGSVFGLAISFFLYQQFEDKHEKITFCLIIMLLLSYTASPVVIRLAAELKFSTSNIGRLIISAALINEMSCLLLFNTIIALTSFSSFKKSFFCLLLTGAVAMVNKYLALLFNNRNRNQKYLKNMEVFLLLSVVVAASMIIELETYNSILSCFLFGVLFPKEGKTARTLVHKLNYSVNNFILPIYFGYIGFQMDGKNLLRLSNVAIVVIMVVVSIGSKVSGTLAACHYLKIPLNEGVFVGFMLNLRGHADLLLIGGSSKNLFRWSDPRAYNLLLITIVANTIISGPVVAYLMRREEKLFTPKDTALELEDSDDELRSLSCVYGPRQVPGVVALVSALSGSRKAPSTPFLMHLIELLQKRRNNVSYHELEDDELSDDEAYGGNDVLEIHEAVDNFTAETSVLIRLSKTVSSFATLYEDVCNMAEDLRVSIIIMPFHKHQRIDGKMESGKEGIRATNQKILRHAPCTVGIIIDRGGPSCGLSFSQLLVSETIQHVAILFFGGPDDREALGWSRRMVSHPRINLTVIRFLSSSSSSSTAQIETDRDPTSKNDEVLMTFSSVGNAPSEIDSAFLGEFFNRYVTTGQVEYVEKYVNNGEETVASLKDMGEMYSLFIVGKGGRGHSPLTTGMSDWEECPELGTVGDVLASSELNINSSVLVVQQHRHSKKDLLDD